MSVRIWRFVPPAVLAVLVLIMLFGVAFAPHAPVATVAPPYAPPSRATPLGTDQLGRDVLSRMLYGGRALLATSLVATLVGSGLGALAGLAAAVAGARGRGRAALIMRPLDMIAAVPPILVLLLVVTALPSRVGLALAIIVPSAPLSARVTKAAAEQVVGRAHVEAALLRGESWWWVLGREIAPLVAGPVLADTGVRFVYALYLASSAGFLGLLVSDADWGQMITDALPGIGLQPWAVLAPVLGIALLAISANLASDQFARRMRTVQT